MRTHATGIIGHRARTGRHVLSAVMLASAMVRGDAGETAGGVANPWVTSDALCYDQPVPNAWSLATFHASPALAGLPPKEFCRRLFDIYFDGRRKNHQDFKSGLTLWSHTRQEPLANPGLIELDPILLLNVHGSGYCGIQSGLLEGIYQSRPGGQPGKPAIDARRWFLGGIIHSVTDAYYDGGWHYYDIDIGGYAGDAEKDVWSVSDIIADPKGYYGAKTTIRSGYFFRADGDGSWVEAIDKGKSFTFGDCHMLGHEMSFRLRAGERLTRYFSKAAAGWSELTPQTTKVEEAMKGYFELVYEPRDGSGALSRDGSSSVFAIRSPYNIASSRVEASGKVSFSVDLGRHWIQLPGDGLVAPAVNAWDYLLRIEDGVLRKVTTRGMLHPGALPRVGRKATTMTVASMAPYDTLTWTPDWSTAEALAATARVDGLTYKSEAKVGFSGGMLAGKGSVTVPVRAPAGTRLVKLAACVIGGVGNPPDPQKWIELHLGQSGKSVLVERTTDCSAWGLKPETRLDHWQANVSGAVALEPCVEAEVRVVCQGWGAVRGVRIWASYVREGMAAAGETLEITHGYDGKRFTRKVPAAELAHGPVSYIVPDGAVLNESITLAVP